MTDRQYYIACAQAEREAAMLATEMNSFREHMERAREYDWLAATEPYDAQQGAPTMPLGPQ
jgi:hypothetical protein